MQIKNSFDVVTQNKIIKGALIAMTGSAALGLFSYLEKIEISDPLFASFLVWAIPFGVNMTREWMAGE